MIYISTNIRIKFKRNIKQFIFEYIIFKKSHSSKHFHNQKFRNDLEFNMDK